MMVLYHNVVKVVPEVVLARRSTFI